MANHTKIMDDAMKYETASACIPAAYVKEAAEYVNGKLAICTVIGFPLGYSVTEAKVEETRQAVNDGAKEIDMVVNIADVKNGLFDKVEEEIKALDEEAEKNRKQKISNTMKNNHESGGYRMNSGRGKKGWYKGIFCDSSWELAFVIWNIENNKSIERCKEKREYIFKGEKHIYIPDFIVEDEVVEIKGYSSKQWEEKIKQNPDVKVLYKNDIKPYLDYVVSKYGKNFISLYEK